MIQDARCVFFRLLSLSLHGAYDIAPKRRTAIFEAQSHGCGNDVIVSVSYKKVVSDFTPCATVGYLKENSFWNLFYLIDRWNQSFYHPGVEL